MLGHKTRTTFRLNTIINIFEYIRVTLKLRDSVYKLQIFASLSKSKSPSALCKHKIWTTSDIVVFKQQIIGYHI